MRASQNNSKPIPTALKPEQTIESLADDSGTFSGILGKRIHHEVSTDNLRNECEGSLDGDEAGMDSSERRERR
jgi:hypothetical protein